MISEDREKQFENAEVDEEGPFVWNLQGTEKVRPTRKKYEDDDEEEDGLEEHEDTEWFFEKFVIFGLGMLRDPTGRPTPEAFLAACDRRFLNISIPENALLMLDVFNYAATGRSQALSKKK